MKFWIKIEGVHAYSINFGIVKGTWRSPWFGWRSQYFHTCDEFYMRIDMDRHVLRLTKFQESGERLLPPPVMLDLDPVIPAYPKFGDEGHPAILD